MVHLVGAGPGDPELITVKGLKRLQVADVVVHDRLIGRELLEHAPTTARRIDVGKAPGRHRWPQRRINTLLIAEARRRRCVVRLKGGDPFVFGRGAEECRALVAAGVPFEIVPGVTSAIAAPAYAGIPLTDRGQASAFTVITGHVCAASGRGPDWEALARAETLVILMGLARLPQIAARLRAHGRADRTPVAIVSRGTAAEQRVVRGTLGDIASRIAGLLPPATIVVGEVAAACERLSWFEPSLGVRCFAEEERGARGAAADRTGIVA
jgi:uroporphyrin-III C-methyltransferase